MTMKPVFVKFGEQKPLAALGGSGRRENQGEFMIYDL